LNHRKPHPSQKSVPSAKSKALRGSQPFKKISVCVVSLGCSKNQVDSEQALGFFQEQGFQIVAEPANADLVVVNTCAFIQPAEEEAVNALLEVGRLKSGGRVKAVLAAGCLVSRHGEAKLRKLIPELDGAVLPSQIRELPQRSRALLLAPAALEAKPATGRRVLLSGPGTAYLKISEGCSRCCRYCLIPALRGPLVSRRLEELAAEAEGLARRGVQELIVVAQDTTAFGCDRKRPELLLLLDRLASIPKLRWIRLMYANPDGIGEGLIQRLAREPKLCKYLDMPVQHASRKVLRAMGRPGDGQTFLRLIAKLRRRIPGLTLRTTLLTGFPGETEADHRELLAFVTAARFDRLGVFAYSREAGTPAARMPGQVPKAVKERRLRELMTLQAAISREQLQSKVGQTLECLVEEESGSSHVIGRTPGDAPEVDGAIVLAGRAKPGDFVRARITGATEHDLTGEIL